MFGRCLVHGSDVVRHGHKISPPQNLLGKSVARVGGRFPRRSTCGAPSPHGKKTSKTTITTHSSRNKTKGSRESSSPATRVRLHSEGSAPHTGPAPPEGVAGAAGSRASTAESQASAAWGRASSAWGCGRATEGSGERRRGAGTRSDLPASHLSYFSCIPSHSPPVQL